MIFNLNNIVIHYITEEDFRDIAAANMNTVRIPVGYWIIGFDNQPGGDPDGWKVYAPVLVSFHAANGSQNGNDHSSPADPGNSHWSAYSENVENALDAAEWLAQRYSADDVALLGIGLLTEPEETSNEDVLKRYYYDAYGRIRLFSDCLLTVAPLLYQQGPYASDWANFIGFATNGTVIKFGNTKVEVNDDDDLRLYAQAQIDVFKLATGVWTYWT
ncbi:unnamed protein product [Rotaria socialis]